MVFSSLIFLFIFLPWTLIIHYFLPPRFRNVFLLLVSLVFYFWGEGFLTFLILSSILFNYAGGLLIGRLRHTRPSLSQWVLAVFIAANLGLLIYFKYAYFIIDNLSKLGLLNGINNSRMHLPIGISFYTFHIMSYLIDVYRRDAIPQKKPADLGLYIFLFPQLVAGPIIRYKDISAKIASRALIGQDFVAGVTRFVRGLAKKVIIANTLALIADDSFSNQLCDIPAAVAWTGIICYTLQIYFDFSGYSDMALGLGKMLGFNFPENFNYPYIARSVQDFWQRWHISLSTWFRDYLYIPLGGNRNGNFATYRNLFIVFFITGLWHGSSWNFIAWGLFHGSFLVIERIGFRKVLNRLPVFAQHAYTLLVVIMGWVFFRAWNLKFSIKYFKALFGITHSQNYGALVNINVYTIIIAVIALLFATRLRIHLQTWLLRLFKSQNNNPPAFLTAGKFAFYMVLLIFCAMELARNNYNPFIYYRF